MNFFAVDSLGKLEDPEATLLHNGMFYDAMYSISSLPKKFKLPAFLEINKSVRLAE
jgi:hypothetical protein